MDNSQDPNFNPFAPNTGNQGANPQDHNPFAQQGGHQDPASQTPVPPAPAPNFTLPQFDQQPVADISTFQMPAAEAPAMPAPTPMPEPTFAPPVAPTAPTFEMPSAEAPAMPAPTPMPEPTFAPPVAPTAPTFEMPAAEVPAMPAPTPMPEPTFAPPVAPTAPTFEMPAPMPEAAYGQPMSPAPMPGMEDFMNGQMGDYDQSQQQDGTAQPPQEEDNTPANFQLGTKLPAELRVPMPPHTLNFDEKYFMRLLAASISLSREEKKKIIQSIPKLRQAQIDELIRIFEEEKQKFAALTKKHLPQLEKLATQHYHDWMSIEDEYAFNDKRAQEDARAAEIRKQLGL